MDLICLVSILIFIVRFCVGQSQITVRLYKESSQKGEELNFSTDHCKALPDNWKNKVKSLDTVGNCVELHNDDNCVGSNVEIMSNSPAHFDLSWWNFTRATKAVSPCKARCSLPLDTSTFFVTLFESAEFDLKGHSEDLEIVGCTRIPKILSKRVSSINIHGNSIELYKDSSCSSSYSKITPNSPSHNNLYWWGMDNIAKSISPCSFSCFNKMNAFTVTKPNDTDNTITLFDEINHHGVYFHLRVEGCTNVPDIWNDNVASVNPNGGCYELFEFNNCDGNKIRIERDSTLNTNLEAKNFSDKFSSVRSCRRVTLTTTTSTTETTKMNTTRMLLHDIEPEASPKNESNNDTTIIIATSVVISILLIVCIAGLLYWKLRTLTTVVEHLTMRDIEEFRNGDSVGIDNINYVPTVAYDSRYEVCKEYVEINTNMLLGSGAYGIVYKGIAKINGNNMDVAIKTAKPFADVQYLKSLLTEVKVMIHAGQYPRIIQLIGCCTQDLKKNEIYILLELCTKGALDKYLKDHRTGYVNFVAKGQIQSERYQNVKTKIELEKLSTVNLLIWSFQIADGMAYLASKNLIHGDLATRNILLDEQLNVKVSDFGLSRRLYQYTQYFKKQEAPLPWRWLSIEALKNMEFSTKSDVWSFGISLWELFTLAQMPYPGIVWSPSFLDALENGLRPSFPAYCTSDIYNVMLDCWKEAPEDRPAFEDLKLTLRGMLETYELHDTYKTVEDTSV